MSIYTKLNKARTEFHLLPLKKSGWNSYAEYSYFELADFLRPAMEIFQANDLCAFVSFSQDIATMTIVDISDTASTIVITSPMGSAKLKACHEVQNIGAVETYQRRYLWITALEIIENSVIDDTKTSVDAENTFVSFEQCATLQEYVDATEANLPALLKTYGITKLSEMRLMDYEPCMKILKSKAIKHPLKAEA